MIFLADIHAGMVSDSVLLKGEIPSKLHDTMIRFREAILVARKRKECVCVGGDLWTSSSPSTLAVSMVLKVLRKAEQLGVDVYIIPGNHDQGRQWASVLIPQSIDYHHIWIVTKPTVITIESEKVVFLPHMSKRMEEKFLAQWQSYYNYLSQQDSKVIITHAQIGSYHSSEQLIEAGNAMVISAKDIPDKYRLILAGHIHRFWEFSLGTTWVVYPGSVAAVHFDEAGEQKGYLAVSLEKKTYVRRLFRSPCHELVVCRLDLVDSTIETALSGILPSLSRSTNIFKLIITTKSSSEVDTQYLIETLSQFGSVARIEYVIVSESGTEILTDSNTSLSAIVTDLINSSDSHTAVKKRALFYFKEAVRKCSNE